MPQLFKAATVDDYHYKTSLIEKTIEKPARAIRLYEREQEEPLGYPLLGLYVLQQYMSAIVWAM